MTPARPVLRTRLCDRLGIEYPIVQAGMGGVSGPELVAAVSNAGALGILAARRKTADQVRAEIRSVRAATDRPFGVNLWLHRQMRPPTPASAIDDQAVAAVHRVLNTFRRRLGLPDRTDRPAQPPDILREVLQVVLDERVPVFSTIFGPPERDMIAECHRRGITVLALVSSVADARIVAGNGADVIMIQGGEAGGHRGTFEKGSTPEAGASGLMSLIPEVVDAVRVPVVAAGGLVDGRGLVAAIALGAAGIAMGTRFVATRESLAADRYKKALLESEGDTTTMTDAFSGLYGRVIANAYTEEYRRSGATVLPLLWHEAAAGDIFEKARADGNADYLALWAGQGVGLIHDLPGAAEVVEAVVREARALLREQLPRTVALD